MKLKQLLSGAVMAAVLFTGCSKDEKHATDHPDHGKLALTTDWSDIGGGLAAPASYTVKVGDHTETVTGVTNTLDKLFEPGDYRMHMYNPAEHIVVSGTTSTVAAATPPSGQQGTFVHNAPGWLFSCAMDVTLEKDKVHPLTAMMRQQVRQLTLVIEPAGGTTDRIENITGVLSGVAGTLDLNDGAHSGPANVTLTFSKITEGTDAGKWTATVRLLGIAGAEQHLTGTIAFAGGSPESVSLDSDLSAALAAFNSGKKTPLTLGGEVAETPTSAGFTATIKGWNTIPGGPVTAQ